MMETPRVFVWVGGVVDFFGSVWLVDFTVCVIIKTLRRFPSLTVLVHLTALTVCNILAVK